MVNKCFFSFIKSLENEEEKVQILILFLEDLDFTNETEFGYFSIYNVLLQFKNCRNLRVFCLASNRSSSLLPSHPITLKPIIHPCKTLIPSHDVCIRSTV